MWKSVSRLPFLFQVFNVQHLPDLRRGDPEYNHIKHPLPKAVDPPNAQLGAKSIHSAVTQAPSYASTSAGKLYILSI